MQVLKTIVTNGTTILPVDTIAYAEGLWLVPHWVVAPDGRGLAPDRIIRIDRLALRKLGPPQPWDYHLLDRIPYSVLDGALTAGEAAPFEIIDRPKHIVRDIGIY